MNSPEKMGYEKTKISKIINAKIPPAKAFVYRLEKHCEGIIPAIQWYKLHLREVKADLVADVKTKHAQFEMLNGHLSLGLSFEFPR